MAATIFSSSAGEVASSPFGKLPDGQAVTIYTLKNGPTTVRLIDYGATVIGIDVPDRAGKVADIALGFDSMEGYLGTDPYFGSMIGRYGNRIAKGKFTLDGATYTLATNNGANALHGGVKGFDKVMWKGEVVKDATPTVRFTRLSPDGEEGYPGNLTTSVTYTLTAKGALKIAYKATTDKPTVVNLTNHTYFNLAGQGNGTILDETLRIGADAYTPVDAGLIPTGELKPVVGTPFDFRTATVIGERIKETGGTPVGYDHNFVLKAQKTKEPHLVAEAADPKSGRWLKVYTDQPGLQFYSGNFLDGTLHGKGGAVYPLYGAFCLETQHFPDSPNQPTFPSTVLRPGETFRSITTYAFGAK